MTEKLERAFVGVEGFIVSEQNKEEEKRKKNLLLSYLLGSQAVEANTGISLVQNSFQGWP